MSYTNMQYTNPGWTNDAPPPTNASNLDDISNALQSVNVTQQERATLGASITDTLGKILLALKSLSEQYSQQRCNQLQTLINKNYSKIVYGSYTGNGQDTLQINYAQNGIETTVAYMVVVYESNFYDTLDNPFAFMFKGTDGGLCQILDVDRLTSQSTMSFSATFQAGTVSTSGNNVSFINANGRTYNFIVFS